MHDALGDALRSQRRSGRSVICLALAMLAAGALMNVGMAWAIASSKIRTLGERTQFERAPTGADIELWRRFARASASPTPVYASGIDYPGHSMIMMHELDPPTNKTKAGHMMQWSEAGWPFRSMEGAVFHDVAKTQIDWHGLVFRDGGQWAMLWLPLRPLWPGFIVNSVLYGTLLWLTLLAALRARGTWRRLRHRCPRCSYPVAREGEPGCPECGWQRGV